MSAAQDLLNDQQTFITTLQSNSSTAIANATSSITQFAPKEITVSPISPVTPYAPGTPPAPPSFAPIQPITVGSMPTMSDGLQAISPVFSGAAPTFNIEPPSVSFGNAPSQLAEFTTPAPNIDLNFSFPNMPAGASATFSMPTLSSLTAPVAPEITAVTFNSTAPINDAIAPTGLATSLRSDFSAMGDTLHKVADSHMDGFLAKINPEYNAQMTRIEFQLSKYLEGGTGLKDSVENAIYSRARSKNDAEARRVRDQAMTDAAARGFTLPTGALMASIQQARQSGADNNATAAREIVVMQAEMEQKNLQFAVTTSADIRKSAVASILAFFQSSISMSNMALDYAKSIMGAMVQVYDTQVKVFSAKLEAYKTEASVYDIKSRAAMQLVDIYKAQIQAFEAMTNVDKSKIDMYRAQIATLKDYADIYKAQVDAVVSEASLEKLRIDLFQAQVQAHAAQVQAKSAEWQGYQAQLAGEETKVKIFSAQADAFGSSVAAFKAQNEAVSEKIRAEASRNNSLLQELTAKVGAYEADIRAQTAIASGNMETLRQSYAAHKGMIDHAVATEQMKLEGYKANVSAVIATAKQNIEAQVANAGTSAHTLAALAQVHGEILKVYSGPASAAAAGMNSLASINFDES